MIQRTLVHRAPFSMRVGPGQSGGQRPKARSSLRTGCDRLPRSQPAHRRRSRAQRYRGEMVLHRMPTKRSAAIVAISVVGGRSLPDSPVRIVAALHAQWGKASDNIEESKRSAILLITHKVARRRPGATWISRGGKSAGGRLSKRLLPLWNEWDRMSRQDDATVFSPDVAAT
jgi:hypothetical protein